MPRMRFLISRFARRRMLTALRRTLHRVTHPVPPQLRVAGPKKLHVGSGPLAREGWLNLDAYPYPGVDYVLDIRAGLPFDDVSHIYAEHFLEHLELEDGLGFLTECRRVLREDGVVRLSTPNLDWVWSTQYHLGAWSDANDAVRDCFLLNKSFRGWSHRFLYNLQTLTELLHAAGFAEVRACAYGESGDPVLAGMERHPRDVDGEGLPHVIVVEGRGRRSHPARPLDAWLPEYRAVTTEGR
jgi:predicted SAM-dependent methyltransferase